MRRALPVTLAVLAGLPSAASAATVSETASTDVYLGGPVVSFQAAPGEVNDVTVSTAGSSPVVTVRDARATLSAGSGCQRADSHTVRCGPSMGLKPDSVDLLLGDGDDAARLSLPATGEIAAVGVSGGTGSDALDATGAAEVIGPRGSPGTSLNGDAGDDHLVGSPTADFVTGGPGRDRLEGAGGGDAIEGDSGNDSLLGGNDDDELTPGSGDDRVDGGRGGDTVVYGDHRHRVVVDLAKRRERGAGGERDSIRSVADVHGGVGRDTLRGDGHANYLSGADPGDSNARRGDVLVGRGGNDQLEANGPRSVLDGGRGNDGLSGASRHDRLRCGRGRDSVALVDGSFIPGSCERISVSDYVFSRLSIRGGRVRLRVKAVFSGCHGRLRLRSRGGTRLGSVRWRRLGTRARRLSFRLNALGRRLAATHGRAVVSVPDSCIGRFPRRWRVRL